ncbi:chymotrypsin family serine protease [Roseiflexus castenholzii]|uniref:Uncharacterized protein n=1 Tax=Roseiflexus castenholzii (strain DSM 13941 / HLO8) TaxID=383372 RepID=A7NMG0_ROSCS|nr:hypothetical protein [Roseiflexus castenholzii]ABU58722.1 conserved hypothetical protein [Roseiflexus castenholzii DSM 13941]
MDDERLRAARARLMVRRLAPSFLYNPAYRVSMVDFGIPIRAEAADERPTIRFHVPQKLSRTQLERAGIEAVPRQIGEFVTDVIEGAYVPHIWNWWYPPQPPTGGARARHDPMRGGISISVARDYSAGTLGGLVRDRATGELMILSNWHVLAAERWVAAGLPICQPGRLDGGMPYDIVATTMRHAMRQKIDAAVATLTGDRSLVNNQLNIGSVTGVALPRLGMRITKSGRTTGVTEGIITGVEGQTRLWYGSMQRTIEHVMTIVPTPGKREVSAGGDSGSWWLDADTYAAVGLHFAGSDDPEQALAIDMLSVLDALNVEIVTERTSVTDRRRPEAAVREAWQAVEREMLETLAR